MKNSKFLFFLLCCLICSFAIVSNSYSIDSKRYPLKKNLTGNIDFKRGDKSVSAEIDNVIYQNSENGIIYSDSATICFIEESDTAFGYCTFSYSDSLDIEKWYWYDKESSDYYPYVLHEFHYNNINKETGYYFTYYWDIAEANWQPYYKEEFYNKYCVGSLLNCSMGIGFTYEWDSIRNDWRGTSSSSINEFDQNGNVIQSANYFWDDDLFDWVISNKHIYEYNNHGMKTLEAYYGWNDENDTIVPEYKFEYEYDIQNRMLLDLRFKWNTGEQLWDSTFKNEYEYQPNIKYSKSFEWDTITNDWKPRQWGEGRYEYIFNNRNLLQTVIVSHKFSSGNPWSYYEKDSLAYNSSDSLIFRVSLSWSGGMWKPKSLFLFNYNSSGYKTIEAYFIWNETLSNWELTNGKNIIYDEDGNILSQEHKNWNEWENNWNDSWKEENTYDQNGNLNLSINYSWQDSKNDWINNYKDEKTYNAYNNILCSASYQWDTISKVWIGNSDKKISTYLNELIKTQAYFSWNSDSLNWNIGPFQIITYYYKNINEETILTIDSIQTDCSNGNDCFMYIYAKGGLGSLEYSIDNQNTWSESNIFPDIIPGTYYLFVKDTAETLFEYPLNPVIINPIFDAVSDLHNDMDIKIYPNPIQDELFIAFDNNLPSDISVIDSRGCLIYHLKENNKPLININMQNTPKGMYFIKIVIMNNSKVFKIIRE